MDTTPLQQLEGRWPNDSIGTNLRQDIQMLQNTLAGPNTQSAYRDMLRFDEADAQALNAFATANGMTYSNLSSFQPASASGTNPGWLGAVQSATMPIFTHEIHGTLFGYDVLFMLAYAPSSVQQRDSNTLRIDKRSIIRVTLPKAFPQVYLDSNKNDKGYASTTPTSFKPDQKINMEGSFAQYFDLYAPLRLQLNTLTLLAPNFMQMLIDSSATFDVEFFGNELFLVSKDPMYTATAMQAVVTVLSTQLGYLSTLLPSWNYQPLQPPFDRLQTTYVTGNLVKIGPFRLSPSKLLVIIFIGFILFGAILALG